MISVVVVYNNEQIFNENLLSSLKKQTAEFEFIPMDNTKKKFKSAAEALNQGGAKAKGKYIMFVHQDVDLRSSTWLEDTEKILDSLPRLGIAGVAGVTETGKGNEKCRNRIEHLEDHSFWGNIIEEPERVQTLDECMGIVPRSLFSELQFDEKTCDDWHLYMVDYCLSCRKLGLYTYALPMFIYHRSHKKRPREILKSGGSLTASYWRTLGKLTKKHKGYYKWIYTSCGEWNTFQPVIIQKIQHLSKSGLKILLGKLRQGWQKWTIQKSPS